MLEHLYVKTATRSVQNPPSAAQLAPLRRFLLRHSIENFARKIGFDLVGFSPARIEPRYLEAFDKWLKKGRHGTMAYMEKIEKRRDLAKILPGARSVVVLAINYYRPQPPLRPGHARVARYAYGRDYHKVIKKLLSKLEQHIVKVARELGAVQDGAATGAVTGDHVGPAATSSTGASAAAPLTRAYVDTGPLLERALAEQAGLGRIGKNSCLITKEYGSWVFLAEIITTLDLAGPPLKPPPGDRRPESSSDRWSAANICGNCTRCVTACPTGAIIAPGVVDARLCISYLTIENKEKIPPKLAKIIKKTKRLYGCDICQEVCPHNSARQSASNKRALNFPRIAGSQLSLKKIPIIKTDQQFLETFAGSPLMRAKRKGLQRNARAIMHGRCL